MSFDVHTGEVLGIIGPNGAGKTTLFDLLSGYLKLDSGAIHLNGRDITSMGPASRAEHGLGRSFQDAALFSSLTVEQTIAVACERWIKVRDPVSAALHLPNAYDSERQTMARVHELVDLLGLGRAPHEVHPRAVDGHEARRRSRLPARAPSVGDPARRAVERHRAEGSRGARPRPVAHPRRDRRQPRRHRARHAAAALGRRPDDRHGPGRGDRRVATRRSVGAPEVVESYLGTTADAIERSGAFGPRN